MQKVTETSKSSTDSSSQERLIFSPVATLASQAQQPDPDWERRIIAFSGLKCFESLRQLNRESWSMKTLGVQFLMGFWIKRSATWSLSATPARRLYLSLRVLIGAKHRRDRIWLVAYSDALRPQTFSKQLGGYLCEEDFESKSTSPIDALFGPFIRGGQIEKLFTSEPPLVRGTDGIPKELDAIAAVGNAADPRIIYQIFKSIESMQTVKK
jgi:hypothetical protein